MFLNLPSVASKYLVEGENSNYYFTSFPSLPCLLAGQVMECEVQVVTWQTTPHHTVSLSSHAHLVSEGLIELWIQTFVIPPGQIRWE